jgi:hypothetical protein
MPVKDNLNQTDLLDELFEMRQIAAGPSEPFAGTFMTCCLFNCLQAFLEDSSLAANLLPTMPEISRESHDGAKFTI